MADRKGPPRTGDESCPNGIVEDVFDDGPHILMRPHDPVVIALLPDVGDLAVALQRVRDSLLSYLHESSQI